MSDTDEIEALALDVKRLLVSGRAGSALEKLDALLTRLGVPHESIKPYKAGRATSAPRNPGGRAA